MKSQVLVFAIVLSVASFCNTISYGQFRDAVVADIPVGTTPVFAGNTGNYIYQVGATSYMVNVSDDMNGTNAVLSWQVGTNAGFLFIDNTSNVVDPDVCLVKNAAGVVYAIVAYYDQNTNQFKMRIFNWLSGTQQFNGNAPITLAQGQFESAINIDASDAGDFAIVWDQPGQMIQMAIGTTSGGGAPQLAFAGNPFVIESGTMPDVCIYRNSSTGYKQVDVAYVGVGDFVIVDFYRFADLLNNTISPLQYFRSPNPDLIYRYPRIDCPAPGFGNANSFTVVVEDSDNSSSWYIKSFNSNNCCPGFTITIYNDGSTSNSPYNLTDVANTKPVVAYQNNSDGVNVGWNFDNSFGLLGAPGASVARYPIAMSCDKQAKVYASSNYLVVPLAITYGSQIGNLSISGRLSSSGLYTYLNSFNHDIYYKAVPHVINAGNLRTGATGNFQEWLQEMAGADDGANVVLIAYDMIGKQVFHFDGSPDELLLRWNEFSENTPSGIYTARSINQEGITGFTGKIFIGN